MTIATPPQHATTAPPPDLLQQVLEASDTRERLLRYAQAALKNGSPLVDAEDVVSATIERALKQRERYNPGQGGPMPWLMGLLRNILREQYRAAGRQLKNRVDVSDIEAPEEDDDATEMIELLRKYVAQLPETLRVCVELCWLEENGYDEITRKLNITNTTARKRVSRGLEELRRIFAESEGQP